MITINTWDHSNRMVDRGLMHERSQSKNWHSKATNAPIKSNTWKDNTLTNMLKVKLRRRKTVMANIIIVMAPTRLMVDENKIIAAQTSGCTYMLRISWISKRTNMPIRMLNELDTLRFQI